MRWQASSTLGPSLSKPRPQDYDERRPTPARTSYPRPPVILFVVHVPQAAARGGRAAHRAPQLVVDVTGKVHVRWPSARPLFVL